MSDIVRQVECIKSAQESVKQILTLDTAIVTFTFGAVAIGEIQLQGLTLFVVLLEVVFLFMSIGFGVLSLYSLSGILSSADLTGASDPLSSRHYRRFGLAQFASFIAAIACIGFLILSWPIASKSPKADLVISGSLKCEQDKTEIKCDLVRP